MDSFGTHRQSPPSAGNGENESRIHRRASPRRRPPQERQPQELAGPFSFPTNKRPPAPKGNRFCPKGQYRSETPPRQLSISSDRFRPQDRAAAMEVSLPRIVVVEDDASMSQAIERMLRAGGYTAIVFDSAEATLESDRSALADCLILDIQLPGMSGIELLQYLTLCGEDAPAIFITAHDEPHTRIEAQRSGAKGFLVKPFSGRALLAAVDAQLR